MVAKRVIRGAVTTSVKSYLPQAHQPVRRSKYSGGPHHALPAAPRQDPGHDPERKVTATSSESDIYGLNRAVLKLLQIS